MIQIEAAITPAPFTKLVEVKALLRVAIADKGMKAIRINRNIVNSLLEQSLVVVSKPTFYKLTRKGLKIANATKIVKINIPLNTYLQFDNQEQFIEQYLKKTFGNLFKIMVTTCFSCGCEDHDVEYIVDDDGNEGSYCKECLNKGYLFAINEMKKRKAHAAC